MTVFLYVGNLAVAALYFVAATVSFFVSSMVLVLSPMVLGVGVFLLWATNPDAFFDSGSRTFTSYVGLFGLISVGASAWMFSQWLEFLPYAFSVERVGDVIDDSDILDIFKKTGEQVDGSFDESLMVSGADVFTFYAKGRRCLVLGDVLLRFLPSKELKALIAHEYAHHSAGGMLVHRVHYRVIMFARAFDDALNVALQDMKKVQTFPIGLFARGACFFNILAIRCWAWVIKNLGRIIRAEEMEYYCDLVAAEKYGPEALCSGLHNLLDYSIAIGVQNGEYGRDVFDVPAHCIGITEIYEHIRSENSPARMALFDMRMGSHPALSARINRIRRSFPDFDAAKILPCHVDDTSLESQLNSLVYEIGKHKIEYSSCGSASEESLLGVSNEDGTKPLPLPA